MMASLQKTTLQTRCKRMMVAGCHEVPSFLVVEVSNIKTMNTTNNAIEGRSKISIKMCEDFVWVECEKIIYLTISRVGNGVDLGSFHPGP
jgi:hypothetical protein